VSSTSFDDRYEEPDRLRDQLRRLLTYRTTIAAALVLGLFAGLLMALSRTGSYSSTSEVLVRPTTDPFSTFGVAADNQVSMGTERQIALSAAVASRAARELGQPSGAGDTLLRDLRVTNPPETQVLKFVYTAGTAKRAAQVANSFAEAYLTDRQARTDATVKRMARGLEQEVELLTEEADEKDGTAAGHQTRINALQKRISDIRSYDTSGGDIVRRAAPPVRALGPGPTWLVGLGLLGGLLGGIVLAWLRSALEPRVRSVGEVQEALGAPVLGVLPAPATTDEPLAVGRGGSSRAEAYRTLAFRLRHGEGCQAGTRLLVVAPKADHNVQSAAVNLAAAFAEFGDDVLLVDAAAGTAGAAARLPLLAGAADAPEGGVVVDAGTAGRFSLFPVLRGAATTDGIVASAAVSQALASADSGVSALVTTRPLLDHAEGLAVAQRVDGVLVVGGADTTRDDLRRIRELLGCSGGRVIGAVLDTGAGRRRLRLLPKRGSSTTMELPPVGGTRDVLMPVRPYRGVQGSSVDGDSLTTSR
jgi:capsular polysaccharide biosynthesis protein